MPQEPADLDAWVYFITSHPDREVHMQELVQLFRDRVAAVGEQQALREFILDMAEGHSDLGGNIQALTLMLADWGSALILLAKKED